MVSSTTAPPVHIYQSTRLTFTMFLARITQWPTASHTPSLSQQLHRHTMGFDPHKLAKDQASDPDLTAATDSSLRLEQVQFDQHLFLWCDTSCRVPRPYLPPAWRWPIFDKLHSLSHPSNRATRRIVSRKFVWPGLAKDVTQWARTCIRCQVAKVQRHTRAPRQQFELPDRRFQHIQVDIVGHLPKSEGQAYLFTIVDRFTRWPEAVPMADSTAASCAQALLHNWIARFGISRHGNVGQSLRNNCGINLPRVLAFSVTTPQLTTRKPMAWFERLHRHLKASLTASTWTQELSWVLLGLRTAFKEDIDSSSAELVYVTTLSLPGELIVPNSSPDPPHSSFLRQLRNVANSFSADTHILPMVNTAHTCQQASNRLVLFLFVVTHTSLHCSHLMTALFLWFLGIPSTFSSTSEAGKTKCP